MQIMQKWRIFWFWLWITTNTTCFRTNQSYQQFQYQCWSCILFKPREINEVRGNPLGLGDNPMVLVNNRIKLFNKALQRTSKIKEFWKFNEKEFINDMHDMHWHEVKKSNAIGETCHEMPCLILFTINMSPIKKDACQNKVHGAWIIKEYLDLLMWRQNKIVIMCKGPQIR